VFPAWLAALTGNWTPLMKLPKKLTVRLSAARTTDGRRYFSNPAAAAIIELNPGEHGLAAGPSSMPVGQCSLPPRFGKLGRIRV
jgi:hypothetical protein